MAVKRWNGTAWEIYAGASASDPNAITTSLITAAGDLIVGTGTGAVARLALGASGLGLVSTGSATAWGTPTPAAHVASHGAGSSDEFKGRVSINAQAGTSYTLALSDEGVSHLLTLNNGSPISLAVPTFATVPFPLGAQINVAQTGTGQVTFAPASGVTIIPTTTLKLRAQGSTATLINIGTNSWLLVGDITA